MEHMRFKAETRTALGTRATRALRGTGRLPVVIYGHGETPETISLSRHDVEVELAHGARTLDVQLGGKSKQYLIKEVQYDHMGHVPIHLDLARVDLDERVTVRVGIELRGTPKGISDGGVLDQLLADIEVECLVTQIPETLHPLVAELAIGDSLLVGDLELPAGAKAVTESNERIATVRVRHEEVEPEPETEEEDEKGSAEPERIGRVRKDEDEQAGGKS